MASCEKCWRDAGGNPDRYRELVHSRECSPEDQAGEGAETCPKCGRAAMHIYCHVCMSCGFDAKNPPAKEQVEG